MSEFIPILQKPLVQVVPFDACYVLSSRPQLIATLRVSNLQNGLSSTALVSSCKLKPLASFRESIHLIFGLPLFLLPSTFPSMIVFLKKSPVF